MPEPGGKRLLLANAVVTVAELSAETGRPADAVLVDGTSICGVGTRQQLRAQAPDAVVERLPPGVLAPAFIDPHHHFLLGALSIAAPPLATWPGQPLSELLAAIAVQAGEPGAGWVRLHGYDPRLLAERRPPTRADLDAICPDRPLVVMSYSWHEAVLNTAGFAAMGWSDAVRDTSTGRWVRDWRGRLTGEVRESPAYLAEAASRTPLTDDMRQRWLKGAAEHASALLSRGIVRVGDAAVPPEFDQLYLEAVEAGVLDVAVHRMGVAGTALCHARDPAGGSVPGPAMSPAGALKLILDGGDECAMCLSTQQLVAGAARAVRAATRGDRGAAIRAGLRLGVPRRTDGAWQRGVRFWDQPALRAYVRAAAEHGQPLAFHAIGTKPSLMSSTPSRPATARSAASRFPAAWSMPCFSPRACWNASPAVACTPSSSRRSCTPKVRTSVLFRCRQVCLSCRSGRCSTRACRWRSAATTPWLTLTRSSASAQR